MWLAIRAELAYFRPWLLGGMAIAFGVVGIMVVLTLLPDVQVGGSDQFFWVMFPIIAGMVVSFIAQGMRAEEHRSRLLLSGPLTPRQLAGAMVLLPVCLVGMGVLAGVVLVAAAASLTGDFGLDDLRFVKLFALQFWAYAQLGPLAQESSTARRERRTRASLAGWAVFVIAILILAASQFLLEALMGQLAQLGAALAAMGVAWLLFQGRTDFTK